MNVNRIALLSLLILLLVSCSSPGAVDTAEITPTMPENTGTPTATATPTPTPTITPSPTQTPVTPVIIGPEILADMNEDAIVNWASENATALEIPPGATIEALGQTGVVRVSIGQGNEEEISYVDLSGGGIVCDLTPEDLDAMGTNVPDTFVYRGQFVFRWNQEKELWENEWANARYYSLLDREAETHLFFDQTIGNVTFAYLVHSGTLVNFSEVSAEDAVEIRQWALEYMRFQQPREALEQGAPLLIIMAETRYYSAVGGLRTTSVNGQVIQVGYVEMVRGFPPGIMLDAYVSQTGDVVSLQYYPDGSTSDDFENRAAYLPGIFMYNVYYSFYNGSSSQELEGASDRLMNVASAIEITLVDER